MLVNFTLSTIIVVLIISIIVISDSVNLRCANREE